MLCYKTIFDGRAINTLLIHKSNNIYIFTWLKHLKFVKAYTCKLKLVFIHNKLYQLNFKEDALRISENDYKSTLVNLNRDRLITI